MKCDPEPHPEIFIHSSRQPRISMAIAGFGLLAMAYLAALIWADSRHQVFSGLPKLASVIPILITASSITYFLRYLRWYWLLRRSGHATPFLRGFPIYLSGFAFTATPGKVGELVRIRYLKPLNVPVPRVVAAFIFERTFDLIAVLMLASLAIASFQIFIISAAFAIAALSCLALASANLKYFSRAAHVFSKRGLRRAEQMIIAVEQGLSGCRRWLNPTDIAISLILGLIAWLITSLAFLFLLNSVGVGLPFFQALSIYPLSILAGAASMLPGGVGSTEVTIVALLSSHELPIGLATLVAVGIRFSSIWFAVLSGFGSIIGLEILGARFSEGIVLKP